MKVYIKKIFFGICYYTGIIAFFYHHNKRRQRILVFHHIISDEDLNRSFEQQIVCTSVSKFKWMMEIINKRFSVSTVIGEPATAVITFDDGYRAIWNADKVLQSFNNTAIIFIPLSAVGGNTLWIDKIMAWFSYVPAGDYDIDGRAISLTTQDSRLKAFNDFVDSLYRNDSYNPADCMNLLERVFPIENLSIPVEYFRQRFSGLSHDEVDELKTKGYKFGAHSINHDILSCLSHNQLKIDFHECELQIGKLYNTDVYAYPFGHKRDVNENAIAICEKSQFSFALMNENVVISSNHKLSRLNISHYESKYEIEAALSGLTQWLKNKMKWIK